MPGTCCSIANQSERGLLGGLDTLASSLLDRRVEVYKILATRCDVDGSNQSNQTTRARSSVGQDRVGRATDALGS